MKLHESVTVDRIMDAIERQSSCLDNPGFCVHCGAEADECEPDARKYLCEECGHRTVYGAEELLIHVA